MTESKAVSHAAKKRRTDAGEWVDDTIDALAQSLGKRVSLMDLPADVIKFKIMSLLTVSENTNAFQKGYLMLPPSVSYKKHGMLPPHEFYIPAHVIREQLNETPDPSPLIECWQRSKVGADVKVVEFDPSVQLKIELPEFKQLIACFPKATSFSLQTNYHLKAVLDLFKGRAVPLLQLHLVDSNFVPSQQLVNSTTPALLRAVPHMTSLHLSSAVWCGDSVRMTQLVGALSKQLVSLHVAMRRAPSVELLETLWKQCPLLVDVAFHDTTADSDSVPLKGKFAKTLAGDTRRWRSFRYTTYNEDYLSTEDLLAIAGPDLNSLELRNSVHVNEVDFKAVFAKCSALQVLDIDTNYSEKAMRAIMESLALSPVAKTLTSFKQDPVIEGAFRFLPRLETVYLGSDEASDAALELLGHADRRNALKNLTVDQVSVLSADALARVLLNSTRWVNIRLENSTDKPLPLAVLKHLADRCPDLVEAEMTPSFQDITGDVLAALMQTMRHGSALRIGDSSLPDSTIVENHSIELKHLIDYNKRPRTVELDGMVLMRISAADIRVLHLKKGEQSISNRKFGSCVVPQQVVDEYVKQHGRSGSVFMAHRTSSHFFTLRF